MNILGISAFYHDAAAALIQDGKVVAAAQEERFTRIKHDPDFPLNAVKFCLQRANLSLNDLDAIAFYDKPLLKFERLLETYYAFAPKGLASFITAMPVWLREKMFLKNLMRDRLKEVGDYDKKRIKFLFPEHHLSHAASAFYVSPFRKAAILTIDGVGEWATASLCLGEGKEISVLKELKFPHSAGLLYSAFTWFLGFKVNADEYKLMGLAPYGNTGSKQVEYFVSLIRKEISDIKEDGSLWLNQEYFNYATGLRMIREDKWQKLFGFPRRKPESAPEPQHCNLALAIQQVTEEIVIKMAAEVKRLTHADNLCMAGGVALNCVANGKLSNTHMFKDIFITPAAGDAGAAIGAGLAAYHIYFGKERIFTDEMDGLAGSYLGPGFSEEDAILMAEKYGAIYRKYEDNNKLCREVAALLADGNVTGWMRGRMEFGPRALGARSILADARNEEMQEKLNLKIKFRESFRPFAPAVLAEDCSIYFNHAGISPYMQLVQAIQPAIRKPLPENYHVLTPEEKLQCKRSDLPAITHVDFSARLQTVHKETNPVFHELITEFKKLTGVGVVINTSFNVRDEPIVCTPEDAYRCFMQTGMDYLVIENLVFSKKDQPQWIEAGIR